MLPNDRVIPHPFQLAERLWIIQREVKTIRRLMPEARKLHGRPSTTQVNPFQPEKNGSSQRAL